ncbi:MAG: glucosaminidase domain-containing protein [Bacteroidetes bacterium]|nr:glucosaminidase domain-containing protein [Bacteroidota bacterium]MBL6943265.1 glucosaminidase domain-containing protein [Bacteroidales bacterium]
MAKFTAAYTDLLIPVRKFLLTFLFILFSFGSYTYSEIAIHPTEPIKRTTTNLLFLNSFNSDFSLYYLTTGTYLKRNSEKKVIFNVPSESIMDEGKIKSSTLARFLINNNQNIDFSYVQTLADLYIEEASFEGVNPDIAFTQMCHETGFLRFDGDVDHHQNNFCGLGVTGNGVKGLSFKDIRHGIRAHIQHLKAYASTQELNNKLVDARFYLVKRGSVTHLGGLTGKWATDIKYDKKIRRLLNRLYKLS